MDSEGEHSAKGGYNIVSFYFFWMCVDKNAPENSFFLWGWSLEMTPQLETSFYLK